MRGDARTSDTGQRFAKAWVAAWNAHDLDTVLAHYSEGIVFHSPMAKARAGHSPIIGKPALRAYWAEALAANPGLCFTLESVLTGADALTLLYRNHRNQRVAETLGWGADGRVIIGFACYADDPGRVNGALS